MRRARFLAGIAFLALAGCQSISEDTPANPAGSPLAINIPPGGGPPGPSPSPQPTPTPLPTPTPTPTPAPTPTPEPTPEPGGPVAKARIKVIFVVCNNQGLPNSENATQVAVGCKVHMDLNLKDAYNNPTDPHGTPEWHYSNRWSFEIVDKDWWGPVLRVTDTGSVTIWVTVDGVRSNDYTLRFIS